MNLGPAQCTASGSHVFFPMSLQARSPAPESLIHGQQFLCSPSAYCSQLIPGTQVDNIIDEWTQLLGDATKDHFVVLCLPMVDDVL